MSNTYYEFYYHIVWSTKKRLELNDEKLVGLLRKKIVEKTKDLDGNAIEFNAYKDHCHLLASVPPKISISDFTGQIKGYSSHEINQLGDDMQIQWQRGFGAPT